MGEGREALRVLLGVTHLGRGGAEVLAAGVAERLVRAGHAVRVVSLMPVSAHRPELEAAGVEVRSLEAPRAVWSARLLLGFRRQISEFRPDVVHTHTFPANAVGRLVRSFVHVPALVSSAHNVREGGAWRMAFYRLTDRLADATTNCSEAAVRAFREAGAAPPGRLRLLSNGVDVARFAPDPAARAAARAALGVEGRFVWIAVGRLEPQKDLPGLVDAAARALGPDDVLLVVGAGPVGAELPARAAAAGIGDRVRLLGMRADVPDLLRAADAYVMSSRWEGLPLVLVEASAAGLPIVATRVGGNADVVEEGRSGALVPPGDPAALAAAMVALRARTRAERAAMGEVGRARAAARYGIDAVAAAWLALYREVLAAGDGTGDGGHR